MLKASSAAIATEKVTSKTTARTRKEHQAHQNHTNNPTMPPTPRSNRQVSNTDTNYSILEQNQTILTQLLLKNQQKENDEGQTKEKKQRLKRIKKL